MVEIGIDFDKADLKKFEDTLKRFQRERNKSAEQSVKWGTISVVGSLRASTRLSKERRKVLLPKSKKEKDMRDKLKRRLYYIVKYDQSGSITQLPVWAYNKKDALRRKIAKIENRGLAKLSWGWALRDLYGTRVNIGKVHKSGVRVLGRAITTRRIKQSGEHGVEIVNRLDYISKSFKTKGKTAVTTAMARATKGMVKKLDNDLRKAGF